MSVFNVFLCYIHFECVMISEHLGCVQILFKNYLEETCRALVPQHTGLLLFDWDMILCLCVVFLFLQ